MSGGTYPGQGYGGLYGAEDISNPTIGTLLTGYWEGDIGAVTIATPRVEPVSLPVVPAFDARARAVDRPVRPAVHRRGPR